MASGDKIKGLTVKIGADTSDFLKELKKVDKEIKSTQKTADALEKSLQLEFNENRFTQAQKKIQSALKETEQKAAAIKQQLSFMEGKGAINTEAYEKLQTELANAEAQSIKLKSKLDDLDGIRLKNLTSGVEKLSDGLQKAADKTKIFSAAAAGVLIGAAALTKSTASAGAELQDYSDRLNISAEALQRWQYIAMQSGVSNEELNKAFSKSRDAIGTALSGVSNRATKAISDLVGDLSSIPQTTEGAFDYIIAALAQVEDKTLQAYYANEIFGEQLATNLIPMFNNGTEKLNKLNAEFESIGYLSNEQVQNLADLDDQLNIVTAQLNLAKSELGIALIPVLETINDILVNNIIPAIKDFADWFGSLDKGTQKFIITGLGLIAVLSPVLSFLSKLTGVIPTVVEWLGKMDKAALKTKLGMTALAGAMALSIDLIANWKKMSTVEKILKTLAVAALVAAAAVTVFHAAWSWGIAVGAITAGVVAGIAAIKAAGDEIGIDAGFSDESSLGTSAGANYDTSRGGYGNTTYNEDNSQYNIEVSLNPSGDLNYDAKSLADEVIKQIQIKKQAGRG